MTHLHGFFSFKNIASVYILMSQSLVCVQKLRAAVWLSSQAAQCVCRGTTLIPTEPHKRWPGHTALAKPSAERLPWQLPETNWLSHFGRTPLTTHCGHCTRAKGVRVGFASGRWLSFYKSQQCQTMWIARQQRAHCNHCRYGWLRSSLWSDHTVSTHRCLLMYLVFKGEDESVTQRQGREEKGKWRAEAMCGAPDSN